MSVWNRKWAASGGFSPPIIIIYMFPQLQILRARPACRARKTWPRRQTPTVRNTTHLHKPLDKQSFTHNLNPFNCTYLGSKTFLSVLMSCDWVNSQLGCLVQGVVQTLQACPSSQYCFLKWPYKLFLLCQNVVFSDELRLPGFSVRVSCTGSRTSATGPLCQWIVDQALQVRFVTEYLII